MPVTQMIELLEEVRACTLCSEHLPRGPRPVVRASPTARLLIVGQAPGTRVHETGIPWNDPSGDRLRDWLQLDRERFYDDSQIAIVPMGFCYPGKASGGDQPPRKECAPAWHDRVLETLPKDRLTLLVGTYAQAHYLPETRQLSLTERVRGWSESGSVIPLPHPAWRSRIWMGKNPWFEAEVLPELRAAIAQRIR